MTLLEPVDVKWYCIAGINPEPWEASEAYQGRKNGKTFIGFHKPRNLVAYQEAVSESFKSQNPRHEMFFSAVDIRFYFWRALDSYQMGEGRARRMHPADATNLQKALEDALQGILYENDRTITRVTSEIMAQEPDISPFIMIRICGYKPDPLPILMRGTLETDDPVAGQKMREVDVDGIF